MARLDLSIEISAPAGRVAAFFVPQRMPYWYGSGMDARFEVLGGAADFAAGLKVRILGRVAGKELTHTAVVTAYEWGRLLEWRFQDQYGVRGMQRWEIAPLPAAAQRAESPAASAEEGVARTRVCLRDEYQMPGRFGRFMDRLLTRHAVKRRDLADLAQLKRYAEQR